MHTQDIPSTWKPASFTGLARTVYYIHCIRPYILVISLLKIPYVTVCIIYIFLANPTHSYCVDVCTHTEHKQHLPNHPFSNLLALYIVYLGLARTIYIYMCIRYFWQGNHQMYGHIRCKYTVLDNPMYITSSQVSPKSVPLPAFKYTNTWSYKVYVYQIANPTHCAVFIQRLTECQRPAHLHCVQPQVAGAQAQKHLAARAPSKKFDH